MTRRHCSKELHNAMNEKSLDKMKYLIKDADINTVDDKGRTVLHLAVMQNDLSTVKFLLNEGADINRVTRDNSTLLHIAVIRNNQCDHLDRNSNLIKFLLKQNININAKNYAGESVLHIATKNNDESLIKLLLDNNANINEVTNSGLTVLHYAITNCVESNKSILVIESFLKFGAEINFKNKRGETPLHLAVKKSNFTVTEYLLSKGANINSQTKNQLTPMCFAIKNCNIKITKLLLQNGATIDTKNTFQENLLHLALKIKTKDGEDPAEDDDYSASACAILQRRNSSRRSRRKRRPSSPFSPDAESSLRRRSSVFTTSSGDTAISIDDAGEEQIFENLKLHKEVLNGVKQQPWPLRKKLKLVRQAKAYVRKHEGALQERLAQSRSTRDVLARASIILNKNWQYFKRELVNLKTVLVPWERRIKQIESQFGSAVASYFIFLRWLFWINLAIAAVMVTFVAIPELLATLQNATIAGERKIMLPEEQVKSNHLLTLWEFEGNLKYSPFFYGWYANQHTYKAYKLPLAYFLVNLVVYTYSFVAILRKMAKNSRMSKLSEKEDECAFSWKLFTGWDFMIGNAETAHNRIGSVVLGLKEALLEESERHRDERNWKITSIRIFVNLLVIGMLAVSAYAVVEVVDRSEDIREVSNSWWRQNEITVVMTLITYSFPIFFEVLGMIESNHPRKQLRLQLGRIMVLNLLNMYSLIYALFKKINSSDEKLQSLKPNDSVSAMTCFDRLIPCETNVLYAVSTLATMSLVLGSNISAPFNLQKVPAFSKESFNGTEDVNYSFPVINELFNFSEGNLSSLENVDPYSIFSDWNSEDQEIKTNLPLFFNSVNSTYLFFGLDNTTDLIEPSQSTFNDSLKVGNSVISEESAINVDENEINVDANVIYENDNILSINDDYPHVSYNDYGFLGLGNETIQFFNSSIENTTGFTERTLVWVNSTTESSNKKGTAVTEDKTVFDQWNSCNEFGKIMKCYERICENKTFTSDNFSVSTTLLDIKTRRLLRGLCWETMFGQELAKLTLMDLVLTILATMSVDFFRALFVRYMNNCWCWDLEKQFPQYGDFKIAENILHLVNNQGMVWMGIFFSPGLIVLNVIKLIILMYLRSWTVLTCNVPHEIVFRASRSNNFYLALLLTMLFLCVLPVGYAIVWVEPSWHCGPFSGYKRIYYLATSSLRAALPNYIHEYRVLDYIASPGIVIPLIVLMTLIIYYMVSLTNSLRESNNDLKVQLRQERTEERRKMFKIAEKKLENDNPFSRWKKMLPSTNKSIDNSIKALDSLPDLRDTKPSAGSENGELTEAEQESLPNDQAPPAAKHRLSADEAESTPNPDRKSAWRSSRMRDGTPDSAESSEGAAATPIPRIQISVEEPKDDDSNLAEDPRRSSTDPSDRLDVRPKGSKPRQRSR